MAVQAPAATPPVRTGPALRRRRQARAAVVTMALTAVASALVCVNVMRLTVGQEAALQVVDERLGPQQAGSGPDAVLHLDDLTGAYDGRVAHNGVFFASVSAVDPFLPPP